MKREAALLLDKARHTLTNARTILAAGVADVAARESYMTAFHAAQAILMEREGKVAKTHSGVRSRFGLLAKSDPALGSWFSAFLARGYELKDIADYGYDLSVDDLAAGAALEDASRFLEAVEAMLADPAGQ